MTDSDIITAPVHPESERWGGWTWREPRRGEHFRTCSYCGSIHPEDLAAEQPGDGVCRICGAHGWSDCFHGQQPPAHVMQAVRTSPEDDPDRVMLEAKSPAHTFDPGGWYASWADRKYGWPHKFYVDLANRDPERQYAVSAITFEPREGETGWQRVADLTEEQQRQISEDGWGEGKLYVRYATRPTHHAKFYTAHLSDPRLSAATIEAIEKVSGLHFTFSDGRVGWEPITHA